jgi:N-acetylmuramoyl-L-alanine amidase
MKAARIERVKRRVLREAVAENLEVIRGVPPRALRPANRLGRLWLQRAPYLLLPLALGAYLVRGNGRQAIPPVQSSAMAATRPAGFPVVPEAETTATSIERVTAAAFPLAVKRVVLDAGHGGTDPGAAAATVQEKAITLDIGHRLRMLLERDGFEVITTRADDRTVALKERARLANDSNSDIFVSIHINSIVKHTASRGIETYYLGPTSDPSLTQLAAAENTVSGYSLGDMRKLLDGVYADARRDESHALASTIQQQLYTSLRTSDPGLENWGVKRAPFIVLIATEMPAVLAEVGCLSSEQEAAMLARPEYRQKIAGALFAGIHAFASANDGPRKKGIANHG